MMLAKCVVLELRHRPIAALLSVVGLSLAVAYTVSLVMTEAANERETRRTMRNLGFNVRIVPRTTDQTQLLIDGYSRQTMPMNTIDRLAAASDIAYNHLVATLKTRSSVAGHDCFITGLSGTRFPTGKKKPPMIFTVPPGHVYLGSVIAARLGAVKGDTVSIAGEPFVVDRVNLPSDTADDITLYQSLGDAQRVLGKPNEINEIMAIDCLCVTSDQNPAEILRTQLDRVLPEARVLHLSALADARARQRRSSEQYAALLMPLTILVCGIWLVVLTALNVRDRADEIGLLRALGYSSLRVSQLFLMRSAVIGLVAAAVGYVAGTAFALSRIPKLFELTGAKSDIDIALLAWTVLLTPAFAILASLVPALIAGRRQPIALLHAD